MNPKTLQNINIECLFASKSRCHTTRRLPDPRIWNVRERATYKDNYGSITNELTNDVAAFWIFFSTDATFPPHFYRYIIEFVGDCCF